MADEKSGIRGRGERGERGKRGKRGERGHRGHGGRDGAAGATGPTGTAQSLVILGTDPNTLLIAGHNGLPGQPIYIDPITGTALLAPNGTQVIGILGPSGMTAGQPVPSWTQAGVVVLPTSAWDAVTGGTGGLTPGASYYIDTTSGMLTTIAPAYDSPVIGVAINSSALEVLPSDSTSLPAPPPPPPQGFLRFNAGLSILDAADEGTPFIIPYSPGHWLGSETAAPGAGTDFWVGFGTATESSGDGDLCWASPISATLSKLEVYVHDISGTADFAIRLSISGGAFLPVLQINGVAAPGSYSVAGSTSINAGDRISLQVTPKNAP